MRFCLQCRQRPFYPQVHKANLFFAAGTLFNMQLPAGESGLPAGVNLKQKRGVSPFSRLLYQVASQWFAEPWGKLCLRASVACGTKICLEAKGGFPAANFCV